MIRSVLTVAGAVALLALPAAGMAQPRGDVAGAFIAAAQAQDRKAALALLDAGVSIEFPAAPGDSRPGHAEGQPFVIGYLDGLFGSARNLSLDGQSERGDAVRFLAHDGRSLDRYAIDVEVRGDRVVRVTVNTQNSANQAQAGAAGVGGV